MRLENLLPAGAKLTGVAVTPEGQTYVLDQRSGLYELDGGTAKLVLATSLLTPRFGLPPDTELTDVVALGNERFALTAENDGYLLDLHGGTLTSYFCYVPALPSGPTPPQVISVSTTYRQAGILVKQRTESVAYSPDSLQLFAQPQTIRLDTNEIVGSELFIFPESGGEPTQVRNMPEPAFVAGGMLAEEGQSVLLGVHERLYRTATSGATLVHTFDMPLEIAGMARARSGNLLLLDSAGKRLLEVRVFAIPVL